MVQILKCLLQLQHFDIASGINFIWDNCNAKENMTPRCHLFFGYN